MTRLAGAWSRAGTPAAYVTISVSPYHKKLHRFFNLVVNSTLLSLLFGDFYVDYTRTQ
jgi:hypothetical protein